MVLQTKLIRIKILGNVKMYTIPHAFSQECTQKLSVSINHSRSKISLHMNNLHLMRYIELQFLIVLYCTSIRCTNYNFHIWGPFLLGVHPFFIVVIKNKATSKTRNTYKGSRHRSTATTVIQVGGREGLRKNPVIKHGTKQSPLGSIVCQGSNIAI